MKGKPPEWLSYIKPLDESFSTSLYNQYNNRPVTNYCKGKNRINHELYSLLPGSGTIKFSESPFEGPLFLLLNPHYPHGSQVEMSKYIYILLSFLVLSFIFFYAYISLMSKEHYYTRHELSPFFLYTPGSLRNLPNMSNVAEYSYYHNANDMQARVITTWRSIDNIFLQKTRLIDFLKRMGPSLQSNRIWFFHNKNDYANNFQRYYITKHHDSLQMECSETIERQAEGVFCVGYEEKVNDVAVRLS